MVEARGRMPTLKGKQMQSLYDQKPEAWAKLASEGKPSLGEMAKHFYHCADMDDALGYTKGANHWMAMRNGASRTAEKAARLWLANRDKPTAAPVASPAPDGVIMLVICPGDKADKVRRVLAMMGCEVDE